ncbi:type II methionyl aminopeptidase [Methanospirillum sp.]|uniref:type II methionyl aminopeptidase n=1 Tax=Methanospirillum sp. TaxID=45200 RepID=UPI002CE6DB6C|nr:type II methionyl aminopeptidase [Methanospirillum sp.]HOL42368.1 type II methionyl aminopeptidase [Methanospirillum sp.]HPP77889.1 type II methionyl aminopeptidase [Methanospirillum sp.]
MKEEIFDRYMQAGAAAKKILTAGAGRIQVGTLLCDVADFVEGMILDEGFGIAFPVNISLNESAAHDTPSPDDTRVFAEGDMVKLDIGVHLDGYIADTACTVDLGNQPLLCEASVAARDAAIEAVRPGVAIGTLGGIVAHEIKSRGFVPVANLTGHGLDQYCLHTGPNVPNIPGVGGAVLEEGMVLAIEPFASTGTGFVHDGRREEIFSQIVRRPVRLPAARKVLQEIEGRNGMPFARRHIHVKSADLALARLMKDGIIRSYPVLSDVPGSFVSQAEHTMIVTGDGCIVTTA